MGPYSPCDVSWLTSDLQNPLAIGQYINNQSEEIPANVCYQELDIPRTFPVHLRRFIPNINYKNKFLEETFDETLDYCFVRTVILVSLRDIHEGEELYSAYFTEIT